MKKRGILLFTVVALLALGGCSKTDTDIQNYMNTGSKLDEESLEMMPSLEALPQYVDAKYAYTIKDQVIFQSDSVVLNIAYDEEIYQKEKEELDEEYIFYIQDDIDAEIAPDGIEDVFQIHSYTFRIVAKNEENATGIPKSFGMIGTSDEKNSIAYLYFYDFDLDIIDSENEGQVMPDFVNNYFDYDFE